MLRQVERVYVDERADPASRALAPRLPAGAAQPGSGVGCRQWRRRKPGGKEAGQGRGTREEDKGGGQGRRTREGDKGAGPGGRARSRARPRAQAAAAQGESRLACAGRRRSMGRGRSRARGWRPGHLAAGAAGAAGVDAGGPWRAAADQQADAVVARGVACVVVVVGRSGRQLSRVAAEAARPSRSRSSLQSRAGAGSTRSSPWARGAKRDETEETRGQGANRAGTGRRRRRRRQGRRRRRQGRRRQGRGRRAAARGTQAGWMNESWPGRATPVQSPGGAGGGQDEASGEAGQCRRRARPRVGALARGWPVEGGQGRPATPTRQS